MSQTSVKIIADSISLRGDRVTTMQVRFPRFILAEVNTHRVLSRNYRSSRAVPVTKMIQEVRESPFVPLEFSRNKPGMQGGEALTGSDHEFARRAWIQASVGAAYYAESLASSGVHKQYANRVLEPFLYVDGVITATEWDNLFALRCHPDAQPEFQELAVMMRDAMAASDPVVRSGDWHLPYISAHERVSLSHAAACRTSAARCAWVSYKPFDPGEESDYAKAERTFSKLMSTPMHASPMEHVCYPTYRDGAKGNLRGWSQWRHDLERERAAAP
ncbi:MAG: FAD-dependent thymidylate synthase [Silanimonas sp.]